jgi:hypothetical protein
LLTASSVTVAMAARVLGTAPAGDDLGRDVEASSRCRTGNPAIVGRMAALPCADGGALHTARMAAYRHGVPNWVATSPWTTFPPPTPSPGLLGWSLGPDTRPEVGGYRLFEKEGENVAGIGPRMDPNMPPAWSFASTSTTWMPRPGGPGSRAERWPCGRWTAAWRSRSTRRAASSVCTRRVPTSVPPRERDWRAAVDGLIVRELERRCRSMKRCSARPRSRWRARRPTSSSRCPAARWHW